MFTKLSDVQINNKIDFIDNYIKSINPAEGSKFDVNANVTMKTITSLETEINKDINIQINRELIEN